MTRQYTPLEQELLSLLEQIPEETKRTTLAAMKAGLLPDELRLEAGNE